MSPRKITYVIGSLDLGGAEKHICLVAPALKERGWELEIYCLTRRGVQADQVEAAGVKIIGPPSEIGDSQTAIGKLVRLVASGIKLFVHLVSRRPPIVHFFLPAAYLVGAPIAVAARVPVRVMSRRSLNHYQGKHPFLARIERFMHRRMQMLLANSQAVLRELREETADGVAIELIYNGVEISSADSPQAVDTHSADLHGGSDALTLVIVANLIPYKGHADLFRALATVAISLPRSWTLLCVGRDDGIGAALTDLARELSIGSNVRFLGSRTDIPAILASADIGILCSHEEGFSNAILEGMAVGLPMIVTDVGGNAEAVVDRETGFVVPARDPAALGAALAMLASRPDLRKLMSAAARRRAEMRFSLARCVENYDTLYRRLMAEFGERPRSVE